MRGENVSVRIREEGIRELRNGMETDKNLNEYSTAKDFHSHKLSNSSADTI